MKNIAIIGTGIMGNGMAMNFLKNGYAVFVWNRDPEKLKPLIAQGAIAAPSPQAATEQADIVFEVTANDKSSRSVWLGDEGIIKGATATKTLISSGTLSIVWVDELAKLCADKGFEYFDMPLTGSRSGAESGKLTLLVGGDERALEALRPDLAAISEKVLYFGKAGSGARYKLLLNTLSAIHITGFGEVLKIAKEAGMDIEKVGNALAEKPGGAMTNVAWRDYKKTPEPINFSVEWITKDLSYAKEFASGAETPLLDSVLKKFKLAVQNGMNQSDWTQITKL